MPPEQHLGAAADDPGLVVGHLDPTLDTGFGRDSMIRRVTGEPVLGLLLQRALAMEVAHTKVGAGVTDHSRFRTVPYRRVITTIDAAFRLVFGRPHEARAAAEQVYRLHDHINGTLSDGNGGFAEGSAYTAHDASLLTWVWATLVETSEFAYTRWVGDLTSDDADRYYADMCSFARFFGIGADLVPADRAAFGEYYEHVIESDALGTTATSRAMARDVLFFHNWNVPAPLVRPLRVMSIGTLDERVRERLGLGLDASDQRLFERIDARLRRDYRRLPEIRRKLPDAYMGLRRATVSRLIGH